MFIQTIKQRGKIMLATKDGMTSQQITQSLRRLAAQEGSKIPLLVNATVAQRGGKKPLRRDPTNAQETVDLDKLTHVSVGDSEDHGKCVRLVFDQQMYATCGEDANKLITWSTASAATGVRKKIGGFPKIYFQMVVGKVENRQGDLVLA